MVTMALFLPKSMEASPFHTNLRRNKYIDLTFSEAISEFMASELQIDRSDTSIMAVFASMNVERTERGDANFLSMARGACALCLAHGSLDLLEQG